MSAFILIGCVWINTNAIVKVEAGTEHHASALMVTYTTGQTQTFNRDEAHELERFLETHRSPRA